MDVSSVNSAMAAAYQESIQATMLKTSQEIQGAAVLALLASVAMPPVSPVGSLGHNVDIHV